MPSIPYKKGEWPLIFSDAINLSDEEFEKMSEQDIEQIKDERYQQWLDIVTAPSIDEATQNLTEEAVDG